LKSIADVFPYACYGVINIPDGDWFCDRCIVKAKDEPCVLCPVYEGAMKRTEQGSWCHCSCVWWIPEVHFKDPIAMRPVMGVPNVIKARYSMKCIFCDTKNGTRLLTGPLSPRSNYACSPCIGRCLHSVCSQELQIIIPCHLCICHQRGTFDSDVMLFFSIASVLVCILHIFSHFIRLNICSLVSGWCDISDV
jgi:hypothetical protein